jgi:hypothetical protein
MLYTPRPNAFMWSTDNYGATIADNVYGTAVTGGSPAHTKGSNINLLNGIANDCYGLMVRFVGGNSTTVARRAMADILIDPDAGIGNAGSSWTVLINNLAGNASCLGLAGAIGYRYYFPIYLRSGTAIGARIQDSALVGITRVGVRVVGNPTRPDRVDVGSKVQTLGASTATTVGTTVVPGTNAMGSYSATLGTLSDDAWWWQVGVLSNDTTMTARGYLFDVAVNATNKITVMDEVVYAVAGSAEQAGKGDAGSVPPIRHIQSGENVYVRGASAGGAPDSAMSAVVYAMGG